MFRRKRGFWVAVVCAAIMQVHGAGPTSPSIDEYPTIQAALDANSGKLVFVPAGDHQIDKELVINKNDTGLWGPGRIVQTNTSESLLRIENASGVRVRDLDFTRPEGKQVASAPGITVDNCRDIELSGVSVVNNKSTRGSIRITNSKRVTVRDSLVKNYKRLALDDRTNSDLMGYAFICVDGTGMVCFYNEGLQIIGNRIIEEEFVPTRENRDKYNLGYVTVVPAKEGPLTPHNIAKTRYTNNWHQGSGLIVGGLGASERNQVINNQIENAAQGIDIHADNMVIANNIVSNGLIGMKAMHGSRNVMIVGNQFINCDLTGIWLMPGAGSHGADPNAKEENKRPSNTDGGDVVANNIITGLGHGPQFWNWQENDLPSMRSAISLQGGQLPENPPLRNAIITGNYVGDQEGTTTTAAGAPRYYYALYIEQQRQPIPQNITVSDNVFLPGTSGVSNVNLSERHFNVAPANTAK